MDCPKCNMETNHIHMYRTAHGYSSTYLSDSEHYTCLNCGYEMFKVEGELQGLTYVFDKIILGQDN